MKVYINNYRSHWISPYEILETIIFWRSIDYEEPIIMKWAKRLTPISTFIHHCLNVVHPKINYVQIDEWDTWSMDATLARIIVPMLKQLKTCHAGSPYVDDEDVPKAIRSTSATRKEHDEWDVDEFHEARWMWVLDEMIWAFEQKNLNWEKEYCAGAGLLVLDQVKPNVKFDMKKMKTHHKRMVNGFRLFGKYYQGLWD